jgi:hypothetical protein
VTELSDDRMATLPRKPGEAYIAAHWLMPGETQQVMVYAPGDVDPVEAIRRAQEMVRAHDVDWVQLWGLHRQRVGKGPDGFRWAVSVEVRNPAPVAPGSVPEAML